MSRKLVTEQSFIGGVLRQPGELVEVDDAALSGKETNLGDAGNVVEQPLIEISAIAPTGPNPTAPQQLPPGAVQNAAGGYTQPGAGALVSERTLPAEERLAGIDKESTAQGDLAELLAKEREKNAELQARLTSAITSGEGYKPPVEGNGDDELVAGTVAEITADLGSKTDAELEQLRAAEADRERPRKGVLDAIKAELDGRQG